jgi:hypothetical protein
MIRATLLVVTGLLLGACSAVQQLFAPNFQDPSTPVDWFTSLSLSVAFFGAAICIPWLAHAIGGRHVLGAALVAALGLILAGVANILEDPLDMEWAFFAFIGGLLVIYAGLLGLVVLLSSQADRRARALQLLATALVLDILFLHQFGLGVVATGAFAWAAWATAIPWQAAPVIEEGS